jgi:hypothetical protein
MKNPIARARWRRSQIAETFAGVRLSQHLSEPGGAAGFILLFLEARIVGRDADKISLPRICCYWPPLSSFWVGKIALNLKHHSSTFNCGVEAIRDLPLPNGRF